MRTLAAAFACLVLAACAATQATEDAKDDSPKAESPQDSQVEAGRRMYDARCDRCHELYDPAEYTRAQWTRAVKKYGPRSGLARKDYATVEAYLHAGAKDAK